MYKSPLLGRTLLNALLLLPSLISLPAMAASLYWDEDGSYGGDGTWNTSDVVWNTALDGSGTLQAWINGPTFDSANFRNTGNVTVSGTVIANAMNFGASPSSNGTYTLTGGIIDIRQGNFLNAITNRGTNAINSDLYLFGAVASATENNRQRIVSNSGNLSLTNVTNIAGFSGSGNQSLSLESYGGTLNINGNITKTGTAKALELHIGGAGTGNSASYALGGNNSGLSGVVTLNRGSLVLNNNSALPSPATALVVANASTGADTAAVLIGTSGVSISKAITFSTLGTDTTDVRTIGSNITSGTATFSGTITLQSFAASGPGSSLRVTAAAGGTTVFSGSITDSTNSVAITKVGDGTVNFSRATGMSYDGGTTVTAGTLLVNNTSGSGTGTGPVTVDATGTLGGSGTIAGATVIRGTHSPGNSPGIQTFNSNLSYETSAGVLFELTANTSTQGTPTRLFDQIVVGGNLAFTNATSLTLDFDVSGSTVDWSDSFWSTNQSWLVYDVTGTTTNFSNFQVNAANWTDANGALFNTLRSGSSFTLSQSGSDVYLNYMTVPEPSCVVIFTAGLVTLALRRRRS